MSVLEKAKILGEAILASEELIKLRDAEAIMNNDFEARKIIQEFQQAQQEFHQWQMDGNDLTEEHRAKADALEEKMIDNDKIRSYMEAQKEFENLLQQINNIISQSISGLCDDSSCSAGCSGCN
jgi:cell fate (sporulation/competence/biofilm development) regulator YlbF (YheA/YmcA/DUF963 family)